MSWLARSIANSFKLDDEDDDDVSDSDQNSAQKNSPSHAEVQKDDPLSPTSPSRGIKEDISELTKTLTSQFWGVASFLAPSPQAEPDKYPQVSDLTESHEKSDLNSDSEDSEKVGIGGIKSDFAEIGGKFRSSISKLSRNIAVSELSKIASNLLQLGSDNEGEESESESGKEKVFLVKDAIGVTDEAVAFARDISMHPGTWLDFPLPGDDEDDDSFELSDIQQEHALAVEHLVPLLSTLRMELCPSYMSESLFWKIYFVLLHPQLNERDSTLLSTSQVLETRALLSHKLPNRPKLIPQEMSETSIEDVSLQKLQLQEASKNTSLVPTTNLLEASASVSVSVDDGLETEKHAVESSEIKVFDKSMIEEEKHVDQVEDDDDDDDYDDWLKEEEESSEHVGPTNASSPMVNAENEDDVSFSDLEDDDDDDDGEAPKSTSLKVKDPNNQEWVQLNKATSKSSSKKDTNDWLDVDIDIDDS